MFIHVQLYTINEWNFLPWLLKRSSIIRQNLAAKYVKNGIKTTSSELKFIHVQFYIIKWIKFSTIITKTHIYCTAKSER